MTTPLAGLRVLDISRILAGPWVGQTLADLGADVIKVEAPQGDDTRRWGPPFVEREGETTAGYFFGANRGKRSITVDFTTDEGKEILRRLAERSDILIENYKVGGLTKYGLDYDTLKALNPRLIYCSITGFGQTGPKAHRAGYDYPIQGMSGIMSITGEPDGAPQKVGVALTDILTGLYSSIAILSALRMRDETGQGQHIDMALLDTGVAFLANQAMNYQLTGTPPTRTGNYHPNIVPYQVFEVADGHIIIGTGSDAQYGKLCNILGVPELIADPRFTTNADRIDHRETIIALLEAETRKWAKADLFEELEAASIPAGPIHDIGEALNDPHVEARGVRIKPEGIPGMRTPIKFSDAELSLDRTAPKLGEHTDEILREIGLK